MPVPPPPLDDDARRLPAHWENCAGRRQRARVGCRVFWQAGAAGCAGAAATAPESPRHLHTPRFFGYLSLPRRPRGEHVLRPWIRATRPRVYQHTIPLSALTRAPAARHGLFQCSWSDRGQGQRAVGRAPSPLPPPFLVPRPPSPSPPNPPLLPSRKRWDAHCECACGHTGLGSGMPSR